VRTLLVDRDAEFAKRVATRARLEHWEVETFEAPDEALERLATRPFELISLEGLGTAARTSEMVGRFAELAPDVPLVVFAASGSTAGRVAAAGAGATLYLSGRPEAQDLIDSWNDARHRSLMDDARVLVVDRDTSFREDLGTVLCEAGCDVHSLSNPASLFDKLDDLSPLVLLLGRNLPGSGPLPLVRAVRASERWSALPVLLFVGRKDAPFEIEALRAGADAILPKKDFGEQLRARLPGLLARREVRLATGEVSASVSLAEKTPRAVFGEVPNVILLQDDPLFLEMLEYALANQGLRVLVFADGWEASKWLSAMQTGDQRPVVVLEPELAGLDGVHLIRERGRYGTDDLRFVVLSVDGSEAAQILAFQSGAFDYVVKPIRLPILLARIQRLVEMGGCA
jgi:DNA-binding response OmpR family regulator